ncbi:MAG: hypothetical protein KDH92_02635, partial [Chloroflexi bacterium]|nr:hypothetical protein [Chloroflexota bacterium]
MTSALLFASLFVALLWFARWKAEHERRLQSIERRLARLDEVASPHAEARVEQGAAEAASQARPRAADAP